MIAISVRVMNVDTDVHSPCLLFSQIDLFFFQIMIYCKFHVSISLCSFGCRIGAMHNQSDIVQSRVQALCWLKIAFVHI